MKKLVFFLIAVVVLVAVAAYFDPGLIRWVREQTGTAPQSTTVYKWQDDGGEWHITTEPPPPGTEYQEQEYLHGTNVLPRVEKDDQ